MIMTDYVGRVLPIITQDRLGCFRTPRLVSLGGGGRIRPPPSREPMVVARRARRHSKGLNEEHPKHSNHFTFEVTCQVKVRSKFKAQYIDILDLWTGQSRQIYSRTKRDQTTPKCVEKVLYEHKPYTYLSRYFHGSRRSLCFDCMYCICTEPSSALSRMLSVGQDTASPGHK